MARQTEDVTPLRPPPLTPEVIDDLIATLGDESWRENLRISRGPSIDEQQERRREDNRLGPQSLFDMLSEQGLKKTPGDLFAPRREKPGHEQIFDAVDTVLPIRNGPLFGDLLGMGDAGRLNREINASPAGPERDALKQQKLESRAETLISGGPIAGLKVGRKPRVPTPAGPPAPVVPASAPGPHLTPEGAAARLEALTAGMSNAPSFQRRFQPTAGRPVDEANIIDLAKLDRTPWNTPPVIDLTPGGGKPLAGRQIEKFPAEHRGALADNVAADAAGYASRSAPVSLNASLLAAEELGPRAARNLPKHGELTAKVLRAETDIARSLERTIAVAEMPAGVRSNQDILDGLLGFREAVETQKALHEGASELGRAMNALRVNITKDLASGPSEAAYRAAIGRVVKDPAHADTIFRAMLDFRNDPQKLYRLLKDARKVDFIDKADEYIRANALWAPSTSELNIVSGFFQQGLELTTEVLRAPQHAPALIHGWITGYRGALEAIPDIVRGLNDTSKYGGSSVPGGAIDGIKGELIRIPYKGLAIQDAFQKAPMFNAILHQEAAKAAGTAVTTGPLAGRRGKLHLFTPARQQFIKDFLNNPPSEAMERALKVSEEAALQNKSKGLNALLQLRRDIPATRIFSLFVMAPYNAAKLGVRFSPLGAARPLTERLLGYDKTPISQVARESLVIGSATTAGFLGMLEAGNMTGLYPKSKAEAEAWKAQGLGPLMIRSSEYPILGPAFRLIHGEEASKRWYTSNLLGPLLAPAMLAAAARKGLVEKSEYPVEQQIEAAAGAIGQSLINQIPVFQGYRAVNQLLSAEGAVDFIANFARLGIPASTAFKTAENWSDLLRRDPQGIWETLTAQIPGAAQNLRPAVDVLGRDIPNDNSGPNALLPKSSVERPHPVITEELRLRQAVPGFTGFAQVGDKVGTGPTAFNLNPDQHLELKRLVGQSRDKNITALLASPAYQSASDAEKARLFSQTENRAEAVGKKAYGLKLALNSADESEIIAGTKLSFDNSEGNRGKAEAITTLSSAGQLGQNIVARIDAARTQADPKKDNYQLSIAEWLHGADLVKAHDNAPAFIFGTPGEWAAAERARTQYMALIKGMTAEQIKYDQNIERFFYEKKLDNYYSRDGSRITKYVHPTRLAIEKDRLWDRFRA